MSFGFKTFVVIFAVILIITSATFGCERIDAGYAGVRVELYGDDRGVNDVELTTGTVFYNRFTTMVVEFPTFVQNKVWTSDQSEDSPTNQEFTVTTSDALALHFDVGFHYSVQPDKVTDIFKKYRKTLEEITATYLRTAVRNAYNGVASQMTAEEILSNRKIYEDSVRIVLSELIEPEGFIVKQIAIIGKIRTPESLERAINAKIEAVQNAQRAENEKQQVIAEAQKKIEEAKGYAESIRIKSDADAYANTKRASTLTNLVVQQQFLERWNGQLPTYGEVPQLFRDVSGRK